MFSSILIDPLKFPNSKCFFFVQEYYDGVIIYLCHDVILNKIMFILTQLILYNKQWLCTEKNTIIC